MGRILATIQASTALDGGSDALILEGSCYYVAAPRLTHAAWKR